MSRRYDPDQPNHRSRDTNARDEGTRRTFDRPDETSQGSGHAVDGTARGMRSGSSHRKMPAGTTRGGTISKPTPQEPPGPIKDRWALLVGINRYIDPSFPPLKYCLNDVEALETTLQAFGYTVVTLHDDVSEERLMPTRDNVEAELARICRVAGPDDLIWVHIAAHGRLVNGEPVLITHETREPTLAQRALRLTDVEQQMRESQARRRVLTLDACHTGVEVGRGATDPQFIRNAYELAEGFALIAAGTAQQVAQEWEAEAHGVFTYYLLEGLRGEADREDKGFVTVSNLTTHTLDGLRRWNVEQGGLLQEPTARTEGVGDIILADYRRNGLELGHETNTPGNTNPFLPVTGRIIDPSRVFDREREIRHIVEFVQAGSSVALIGPATVGKSSLLTKLLTTLPEQLGSPWETAYLDMQPIFNEEEFFTALCDVLGVDTCRGYPLHRALRGRRILLALDEVDKMAWEGFSRGLRAELRGLAGDATAPLKLLMAARVPLDQLFRDSEGATSPLHNICVQVNVERWDEDTADAFLRHRMRGAGVTFTEEEMNRIIAQSSGHPGQLTLAAYRLFARKTGRDG